MYSVVTCLLHSNSDGSGFLDGVFQHLITHPASSGANAHISLSSLKQLFFFIIILKTLFGVLSLCIYTGSFMRIIYVEFLSHYAAENITITCFSSRFLGRTQKHFEEFDHRHLLMENLVTEVGVF